MTNTATPMSAFETVSTTEAPACASHPLTEGVVPHNASPRERAWADWVLTQAFRAEFPAEKGCGQGYMKNLGNPGSRAVPTSVRTVSSPGMTQIRLLTAEEVAVLRVICDMHGYPSTSTKVLDPGTEDARIEIHY